MDTYVDAIFAVIALINHARWDGETKKHQGHIKYGVGRRFVTSESHPTHPDTEVTPDGAVQLSEALGVIAEAKPGVARSKAVWEKNLSQLKKYDDDLVGWWTPDEKIGTHDIVALVPLSRSVDFVDLVQEKLKDGSVSFDRPLAVVAFVKSTSADQTRVVLKTEFGEITDPVLRERLRRAVPVNWQTILLHYNDPRFIDTEPPLPYTLYILWEYVLPKKAEGLEVESGQNWTAIDVDVEALTRQVQEYYGLRSEGPRSIEVPRQRWIRRALDALVVFDMAERVEAGKSYRIRYRRYRTKDRDTLTFFGRQEFKHRNRLAMAEAAKPLLVSAESGSGADDSGT